MCVDKTEERSEIVPIDLLRNIYNEGKISPPLIQNFFNLRVLTCMYLLLPTCLYLVILVLKFEDIKSVQSEQKVGKDRYVMNINTKFTVTFIIIKKGYEHH